jgi:hypothetical protein
MSMNSAPAARSAPQARGACRHFSGVRHEIGLFGGSQASSAACGHFIHVCAYRETRRPAKLPAALVLTLQGLL